MNSTPSEQRHIHHRPRTTVPPFQPPSYRYALIDSCKQGNLLKVKEVLDSYPELEESINGRCASEVSNAFSYSCTFGQIEVANYLLTRYPLLVNDDMQYTFRDVCSNKHFTTAKWMIGVIPEMNCGNVDDCLIGISNLPENYDFVNWFIDLFHKSKGLLSDNGFQGAFCCACTNGYLDVAKLLFENCPHLDMSQENYTLFRQVCKNGLFEVAQWLYEKMPPVEFSNNDSFFVSDTCRRGHFHIVKWLVEKMPNILYRSGGLYAFQMAFAHREMDLIIWLQKRIPPSQFAVEFFLEGCFTACCESGDITMTKWFLEQYPQVITSHSNNNPFTMACIYQKYEMARWLIDEQIVKPSEITVEDFRHVYDMLSRNSRVHSELMDWIREKCEWEMIENDV